MDVDMNQEIVCYIFSKKSLGEMLCICKGKDDIENPKLQTGIYKMGTMLSKTITLLDACIEKDLSILCKEDVIRDQIKAGGSMPATLSFSSAVCGDPAVDKILEVLLLKYDILIKHPKHYLQYITPCVEEKVCHVERLMQYINENGDTMPINGMYFGPQDKTHDPSDKDHYYIPPQIKCYNPFSIKVDFPKSKKTGYEKLELPLNVFEIHDAVDLILASLYCIFSQNNVIRKCEHCKGLFVPNNKNNKSEKYCPPLKDGTGTKTCRQQARLEQQLIYSDDEIRKLRKNLKSMSYNKSYDLPHGSVREKKEQEHKELLDKDKEWIKKVKKGEKTKNEYRKWLKAQFPRKYKDEVEKF